MRMILPLNQVKMKSEAHAIGLWHRAAHIWIYNSKGEVLLQLRSKDKDLFPNRWDISVAGHVTAGEKVETSAVREISEEIGLPGIKEDELELIEIMPIQVKFEKIQNNEHIYVYLLKYDGDISLLKMQEEELDDLKFFMTDFVRKDYSEDSGKYTPGRKYWMRIMDKIDEKIKK
jgi:isopentenyl-diphosphate delta-isomerase